MIRWNVFSFFVVLVIGFSCRRDKEAPVPECIPIPPYPGPSVGFGYGYITVGESYSTPCFNPQNGNEICFRASNEIIAFDISAGVKTTIYSGTVWGRPVWGENGWIIFGKNHNIYKVKSDGDSLTQLTLTGNCYAPQWCNHGAEFICELVYDDPGFPDVHAGRFTADGVILDSIRQPYTGSAAVSPFSQNLYAVYESYSYDSVANNLNYNLMVIDIETHEAKIIAEGESGILGLTWVDDHRVVWSLMDGIYVSDINSLETTQLKETCNSINYQWFDYGVQSDKILYQKTTQTLLDSTTVEVKNRIYLMNTDVSNEDEIEIP